jgi:hypothetical protein
MRREIPVLERLANVKEWKPSREICEEKAILYEMALCKSLWLNEKCNEEEKLKKARMSKMKLSARR